MTSQQARDIVAAHEARDRAWANLTNQVQQNVHVSNPESFQHEARIRDAGEAYAAAQAKLDQLMIHHLAGTPVDPATLGAMDIPDAEGATHVRVSGEQEVKEPAQIEAPKKRGPGRPRKDAA